MPHYDYACPECEHVLTVWRRGITEEHVTPTCTGGNGQPEHEPVEMEQTFEEAPHGHVKGGTPKFH